MISASSNIAVSRGILLALGFLLLSSSSPSQDGARTWPASTEGARIGFVRTLTGAEDIGAEPSVFESIWNAITGKESELQSLIQPVGVAVDQRGRIFVADPGCACVHVFDQEGEDYERLESGDEFTLQTPVGVVAGSDRVYVTDASSGQVLVFDDDLDPVLTFDTGLHRPTGITLFSGLVYIVDTGGHRIGIFSPDGTPLDTIGSRGTESGRFNFPLFTCSDTALYIVDALNHRIQMIDSAGTCRVLFGSLGDVQGSFASPKGIATDSDGNIYVTDALFDVFQIFDHDGRLLLVVGARGPAEGEFLSPAGLCIDLNNRIYVADTLNRRIQVFQYFGMKE